MKPQKSKKRKSPVDKPFAKAFKNYEPPADVPVSEWAEKNRILSRESSAEAGPWRNERTPYLVEIMNAFTQRSVHEIVVMASAQVGKTEIEMNMMGQAIDVDPGPILYVQPTKDVAAEFSVRRIAPMISCTRSSGLPVRPIS